MSLSLSRMVGDRGKEGNVECVQVPQRLVDICCSAVCARGRGGQRYHCAANAESRVLDDLILTMMPTLKYRHIFLGEKGSDIRSRTMLTRIGGVNRPDFTGDL